MSKMKTYTAINTEGRKVIFVRYPGGTKVALPMHRKHSAEDKYDWGQNSAESLDTALSILLNAFGYEYCDDAVCSCYHHDVLEAYQTFDAEFISKSDQNFWKLTQYSVCDWVFDFIENKKKTDKTLTDKDLITNKSQLTTGQLSGIVCPEVTVG